jgi:hypothetical protein
MLNPPMHSGWSSVEVLHDHALTGLQCTNSLLTGKIQGIFAIPAPDELALEQKTLVPQWFPCKFPVQIIREK